MIKKIIKKFFPRVVIRYHSYIEINENKRKSKLTSDKYEEKVMQEWIERGNEWFDINNPVTYRQKIQWSKLHEMDQLKSQLTDKVQVRKWVAEKIGDRYLIPVIGIFDCYRDIDFSLLPQKFVIKMNHSSGMNIIVKNKEEINKWSIKQRINKWLKINYAFVGGCEFQYRDIIPKILIEKYVADKNDELMDYKFLCFNGKPYLCWVDIDRFGDHRRNIYDLEWNKLDCMMQYKNSDKVIEKPAAFEQMVNLVSVLCEGFSQVRVDMYYVEGSIYFGEMTFTNGSGYESIEPREYDILLGDMWKIDK